MLTRVSIVAAPWPRPGQAVRCSGQAPHTATGVASTRLTHGQPLNCTAGTMASTMTATASGTQTASRRPSARAASSAAGSSGPVSGAGDLGRVPAGFDHADQFGGLTAAHAREVGAPGGVVDARGHPVELVQPPFDPRRARTAAHPAHDQLGPDARARAPVSPVRMSLIGRSGSPGPSGPHGPPMFIEPPVPPPPPPLPSRRRVRRPADVPDEGEPTVTGPRCAPAAYAPMKITASRSRNPHSFAAGLTGTSPSSRCTRVTVAGYRRCCRPSCQALCCQTARTRPITGNAGHW